jgi:hypothetical protein
MALEQVAEEGDVLVADRETYLLNRHAAPGCPAARTSVTAAFPLR